MNGPAGSDTCDDVRLMQRIADGDPEALRTLYDRHSAVLFAICVRILRDRSEAEQLLIDIYTELWERGDRYDATRGKPLTYLVTLTRSRAIDRFRARKKNSQATSDNSPGPLENTLAGERRVLVNQALRTLEPSQRQAVELAFYDGLSHSEIATKLNKPLGTIKTHIRQGLIRLRGALRNQWEGVRSTS